LLSASKVAKFIGIAVIAISLFILNWYFIWTATFTGERLPYELLVLTENFVFVQYDLLVRIGIVIDRYTFADLEALSMFFMASTTYFLLNLRRGLRQSIIRTVGFSSLALMPLGVEVYFLDRGEFWIHVTNLQISLDILPWFSNGDLLIATVAGFLLSLLLSTKFSGRFKQREEKISEDLVLA